MKKQLKPIKQRTLTLNKTTVRELSQREAKKVNGGYYSWIPCDTFEYC